jgi:hypothetical protein
MAVKDPRGIHRGGSSNAEIIEGRMRDSAPFARLFATDDGKAVMKRMEDAFENRPLLGATEQETIYKAAQRDVMLWLRNSIDMGLAALGAEHG